MTFRPPFPVLNPVQQKLFGNGLGPFWMPESLRRFITRSASWFFNGASWRYHDFSYAVGGDRWDRVRCDWKFFVAMVKDTLAQRRAFSLVTIDAALTLSAAFYVAVRTGGQFGSFKYRDGYAAYH